MSDKNIRLQCKRCKQFFNCGAQNINGCECSTVTLKPETHRFLQKTTWGCLCINCLKVIDATVANIHGKDLPKPGELQQGVDYYIENGLFVFTERYHMLRGHCCKSGCRHCPYGFEK